MRSPWISCSCSAFSSAPSVSSSSRRSLSEDLRPPDGSIIPAVGCGVWLVNTGSMTSSLSDPVLSEVAGESGHCASSAASLSTLFSQYSRSANVHSLGSEEVCDASYWEPMDARASSGNACWRRAKSRAFIWLCFYERSDFLGPIDEWEVDRVGRYGSALNCFCGTVSTDGY